MNRWLGRQTNVLVDYVSKRDLGSVRKQFVEDILLQRDKVLEGMLKIKYDDLLEPQSRTELEGISASNHQYFGVNLTSIELRTRIAITLRSTVIPPPAPDDAQEEEEDYDDEGEEDGVCDPAVEEAEEDIIFGLGGLDLEEEVAARIMMQDELNEHVGDGNEWNDNELQVGAGIDGDDEF
jgi:hypothetical protein